MYNNKIIIVDEEGVENIVDDSQLLPQWADRLAGEEYEIGSQLCTRDGRRVGNAMIVGFETTHDIVFASVITDMGNRFWATSKELDEIFHKPKYIFNEYEIERQKKIK